MKGWQIFRHSLRQVTGNFNAALRVSGVLYLAQWTLSLLLLGAAAMTGDGMATMQGGGGSLLGVLVAALVAVVTGLWMAVAWHRYVLRGEAPGAVPNFRGDRILAYFLRSVGYCLISVLIAVTWGVAVSTLAFATLGTSEATAIIVMGFLVYLPLLVITYRLLTGLPAVALSPDAGPFWAGWRVTKGHTGDIIALALVTVAIVVVLKLIGTFVFGQVMILSLIWTFLAGWLQTIVSVSILTTLYGHYIEGRALV